MLELIKGLTGRANVQMELILFKDLIEYPEIYDLGIPLHIIRRKPKHNPATFLKVFRICKIARPDVLHTWSSMSAIFAYPAIKLLNIKLLNGNIASAPHNLRYWDKDYFRAKLTFFYSDVIVGNSLAGLKAFRAPRPRSICIPNGFDFRRIKKLKNSKTIRETYNLGDKRIVGKVAAFAQRKDYKTYIDAAKIVLEIRNDVVFLAIGDGPDLEKIRNYVPKLLRDKIHFTGAVQHIESLVNVFDIGVLCTNADVHGEGISNSIMEYMALRKPVVATEGGGTNEIVLEGETGFLVPPKSPKEIADKIILLLNNREMSELMGATGRKHVQDNYELDKMTDRYFELYSRLIKETD